MNILVTNDDGVEGVGLKELCRVLSESHNVFVLAPDRNRSAVSNSFTIFHSPLSIKKISKNFYSCSGTPVDCVITGLTSGLFGEKIDAVVSGINFGANLGRDMVYSGTCAAARQAVFEGLPGIALSVYTKWGEKETDAFFEPLARFALKNLESLVKLSDLSEKPAFVNVNGASLPEYKGWKFTQALCLKDYQDEVSLEKDGDGFKTVFEDKNAVAFFMENSDYEIVKDGFIAVSSVAADVDSRPMVDGITLSV